MIYTPHPYQHDYLDAIREGWKSFRKQLVVSPTGSGKTCMFSWITGEFVATGICVLILVDQDELVWQTIEKLKEVVDLVGEPEKAKWRANKDARVVVATVQSMARRLAQWPADAFGLVIADEADKSIAPQWQSVLNHFDSHALVCGFTATPKRSDARNLGIYYDNLIEKENLFSLIDKGFLSPIKVAMMPIKIDLSGFGSGKDYTDDEADAVITPHLEEIAKAIQKHASFRRTLVFLPLIKTCQKFSEIARALGLSSEYIYGDDPDRDDKLKRFRAWEFDVLANSMLLTRGVDIPEIDCIVPCRVTRSVTLFFQICGRGTRLAEGKSECLILDFLYQAQSKLVCRPAHLISKTDEEAKSITKLSEEKAFAVPGDVAMSLPMDLQALASDVTHQREEALRKKLDAQKNKKAKVISAEQFAMEHGSLALAEYEPVMKWESDKMSDKQAKYLQRTGIDLDTVKGKGHASKLLDIVFKEMPLRLASPATVASMQRSSFTRAVAESVGITSFDHVTQKQAGEYFRALKGSKEQLV